MNRTRQLYYEAKKLIPGETQLFSKRPEMHHPFNWPAYFQKARGCEVWDLDGYKYIDVSFMGIGTNIIGYADSTIDKAVGQAIKKGTSSTLNCPEEVQLAELLCKIHPWVKNV